MRRSSAFSLIEVMVAVVILATAGVAAIGTVAAAGAARRVTASRGRADALAQDLLAEVQSRAYEDPANNDGAFGPGPGETTRALFNDIDDYDGWAESPPEAADGTKFAGFDGWTREVGVAWVNSSDFTRLSSTETGVKRILVTVREGDMIASRAMALRASAWPAGGIKPPNDAGGDLNLAKIIGGLLGK